MAITSTRLFTFLMLLWSSGHVLAADDPDALFEEAAAKIDTDFRDSWHFTKTFIDDEETWVSENDPGREWLEQEVLISVDGREPTKKELKDFGKRFEEQQAERRASQEAGTNSIASMIEPGSLELIDETDTQWHLSFQPAGDTEEDREFMSHMTGTLTIEKDGRFLSQLLIKSTGEVSPQTGVKIKKFVTDMRFGPVGESGAILPITVDVNVVGRAFLFANFDQKQRTLFSDHARATDSQPGN